MSSLWGKIFAPQYLLFNTVACNIFSDPPSYSLGWPIYYMKLRKLSEIISEFQANIQTKKKKPLSKTTHIKFFNLLYLSSKYLLWKYTFNEKNKLIKISSVFCPFLLLSRLKFNSSLCINSEISNNCFTSQNILYAVIELSFYWSFE